MLSLIATEINNHPPLPSKNEITCYHNYEGHEGEEVDQDEDRGGVRRRGKGQRYGGEEKGGKKREDEERGGGMSPGCVREEEVPSSI